METKCAAFWHHTNVRNDNNIFPCCRFKTPIQKFDGDVVNILNSTEYQKLREHSGPIAGCEKCYYEESLGKKSLRQQFNEKYDTESVSLEFLEIGFDNICNLTCDGCWAEFSSAWSKMLNPNAPKDSHIKSIDEITELPNTIRKILFLGGEPLMTNRHRRMLSLVHAPEVTEVIYNTNGTFLLDETTITLLKKFKTVEFIVSIDGVGKLNEQVRGGSSWSNIIDFLAQLKDLEFNITVHTVVHKNNWHGLEDLQGLVNHLGVNWTTNILTYPNHLDITTVENKQDCIDFISKLNIPNKDYILKHLNKEAG